MSARKMDQTVVNNHGAFIWRIANLLEPTKSAALAKASNLGGLPADIALPKITGRWMLENPVLRTQVTNNTQQQVAESPALKAGFTDSLVEAQEACSDLVKQLFDGEDKRVDYFHSLITLLYAEAAHAGDVG